MPYDPTFIAPIRPQRALDIRGVQDAAREGAERAGQIHDEVGQQVSAIRVDQQRARTQADTAPTEFAVNDQTGEVMLPDGSVLKMNAPTMVQLATLRMKDGSELPKLDPTRIPAGWRTYSQAQLASDIDSIEEDSDFWGELWSSFKTGVGLAGSALDVQIGRDDPSNAWSRSARDYTEQQTIGQYKASEAPWFSGWSAFMSGLGQTAGNISSALALAAPALAGGAAVGSGAGPAGTVGGAIAGVGMAASGGAQAYGEQATDFYEAAMDAMSKMSPEQLSQESPLYQRVVAENPGLSHEQAMQEVATQGARAAGAAGALPGAVEAVIGGRLGGNLLAKLGFRTILAGKAKDVASAQMQRSLGRRFAGGLGRATVGGVAAGGSEMLETGLGQSAGARATGIGDTSVTGNMDIREGIAASQAGALLGGFGGRARRAAPGLSFEDMASGATEDLAAAVGANAGQTTPELAGTEQEMVQPAPAVPAGVVPTAAQAQAAGAAQEVEQAKAVIGEVLQVDPRAFDDPEWQQVAGELLPELMAAAEQHPGIAAAADVMQRAGYFPIPMGQSPESAQQAASAAAQQFATMPGAAPPQAPAQQPPTPDQRTNWQGRVRGQESAQRAAVSMAVPTTAEPLAPPAERTPDGRPVGVAPPPIANPEPMSPEEAEARAQTQRSRRRKAGVAPTPAQPQVPPTAAPVPSEGVTPSTPEPAGDIAAQVEAMLDPETERQAVFVASGNEAQIPTELPPDVLVARRKGRGTLLTLDPELAARFRRGKWTDADTQAALGYSEGKTPASAAGVVVEARTPEGDVAAQQVATNAPKNRRAAAAAVKRQARKDATVVETTPEQAQAERRARAAEPPRNPRAAQAAERRQRRPDESALQREPTRERKLGPKAKAAVEKSKGKKKVPEERAARKEALNDKTKSERTAEGAQVTGSSEQAPRLDVSKAAKVAKRRITPLSKDKDVVDVPESLVVETGQRGAAVDLRVSSPNEELRESLRRLVKPRKDGTLALVAADAAEVESTLLRMDQLDTMLDAAHDAAVERLIDRAGQSAEGNAVLDVQKREQLREEMAQRKRTRGRPRQTPHASPLLYVPLLAEEALHFGRLARREAREALKQAGNNLEVARRLLSQLMPHLAATYATDPAFLRHSVEALAALDDAQIDALVRGNLSHLRHSLVAKQVMRGSAEVAHAYSMQGEATSNRTRETTEQRDEQEEARTSRRTIEPVSAEALGLTAEPLPHVTAYGDIPKAAAKTLDGWLSLLQRGGVKVQNVHVLSMDNAMQMFPDQFPKRRPGRYAQAVVDGQLAHVIAVDWEAWGDAYAIEILAHELGEFAGRAMYNASDNATQKAVRESYENWLAANGHLQPTELFRTHAPALLKTLSTKIDAVYAGKFEEWLANHVARYMLTKPEPQGLVEKFFAKIADYLRKVWQSVVGDNAPDAAVEAMVDAWLAGRMANAAAGAYQPITSTAGDMHGIEMPTSGRVVVQHAVDRMTRGLNESKASYRRATSRKPETLREHAVAIGNTVADYVLHGRAEKSVSTIGLSLMSLDQMVSRFQGTPVGRALAAWTRLQRASSQLANVVLYGTGEGTFEVDGEQYKFKGAEEPLDKAYKLPRNIQQMLERLMLTSTRYGIFPDRAFDDQKHLVEDSDGRAFPDRVVEYNRRRYNEVTAQWREMVDSAPETAAIYNDLQAAFADLYDQSLKAKISNIENSDLSERAKTEATKRIRAHHREIKRGPYFPLVRKGEWIVSARLPSRTFHYDNDNERAKGLRDLRTLYPGAEIAEDAKNNAVHVTPRAVQFFTSRREADAARAEIFEQLKAEYDREGVTVDEVHAAATDKLLEDGGPQSVLDYFVPPSFPKQTYFDSETFQQNNTFVNEVRALLKAEGSSMDPAVAAAIEDAYIEALPEFSPRKALLPRQNVMGASQEMLSAYALRYHGAANNYARIIYGQRINKAMDEIRSARRDYPPAERLYTALRRNQQAIAAQHDDTMNNRIQRALLHASSFMFLAFSPAYVMMNAMQPTMITLPVLSSLQGRQGTLGAVRAGNYLRSAYDGTAPFFSKRAINAFKDELLRLSGRKSDITNAHAAAEQMLDKFAGNENERKMLQSLLSEGRLDFAFLDTIQDAMRTGWVDRKLAGVARLGMAVPQQVETMNRVVTALAAYRIGVKEQGLDHAGARQLASDMVGSTQLDYSTLNRPLAFNLPWLRVFTQFKMYLQGMWGLFAQNFARMMVGRITDDQQAELDAIEDVAARNAKQREFEATNRRQGRAAILYLMGTHGVVGGATGLGPLAIAAKFGVAAAAMAFGVDDEDDEWKSSDQLFQERAAALFGERGGRIASRGVVAELTGIDVADRLGFPELTDSKFVGVRPNDDGATKLDKWALYMAGPVWANMRRVAKSVGAATDGDPFTHASDGLPSGARAIARALRLNNEGLTDYDGDTVVPRSELGWKDLAIQAIGYQPTKISDVQRQRSEERGTIARIRTDRELLIKRMRTAAPAEKAELREEIKAFNEKAPRAFQITGDTLARSAAAKKRRDAGEVDRQTKAVREYLQ